MAPEFRTVQDMVEDGNLHSVPKNYICREEDRWRPESDENVLSGPDLHQLPLIDMEGSMAECGARRSIVVQQIRDACKEWGFFQLKNHGVPLSLMKRMQQVARQVLEVPANEKDRIKQASNNNPGQAEGYKTRSAAEGKVSHWSDRLRLHLFPVSLRNYDLWPTSPTSFRETVEDYHREQDKLVKHLLELISESLGLKTSYLNEYLEGMGTLDFAMNYYPPCPEPNLALGLPKHTDGGALSILLQDSNAGLQVLKNGEWITVKPIEGTFVVNLGDHLEIMSNGKYKSVEHRVFVSAKPRMSIVSLLSPFEDAVVGPIPEILQGSEGVAPKYKQCAFHECRAALHKLFT